MLKYKDFLVLNHKQRRKIWKKEKRRRKRILEFLSKATLKELEPSESEESGDEEVNSNLPHGPLTNFAIICHLKKQEKVSLTKHGIKGILQNANKSDNLLVELNKLDSAVTNQPTENVEVNINDVDFSQSNDTVELPLQQSFLIGADEKVVDNENEEDLNIVPHTEKESSEINDLLSLLDDEVERWHNPMAPVEIEAPRSIEDAEVSVLKNDTKHEDNRLICNFFAKVGICRFGEKCSRKHSNPDISDTLLFSNMFQTIGFSVEERKIFSRDVIDDALEHTEQDIYDDFLDFYEDIKPEFEQVGKVVNLFVCSNLVKHLCGNVYVQYVNEDSAKSCFDKMFGRFYNGKQIFCKFVTIKSWNEAICGIHLRRGSCQRGGQCNFLHIFRKQELSTNHNTHTSVNNRYHYRDYDSRYRRSKNRYEDKHYSYSRGRCRSSSESEDGYRRRKSSKKINKSEKRKRKRSSKKESKRHDSDVERNKPPKRKHSAATDEDDIANVNRRKIDSANQDAEFPLSVANVEKSSGHNESTSKKKHKKRKSHKKKKS